MLYKRDLSTRATRTNIHWCISETFVVHFINHKGLVPTHTGSKVKRIQWQESLWITPWWYAWDISSVENHFCPPRLSKISCTLGIGCLSKSLHIALNPILFLYAHYWASIKRFWFFNPVICQTIMYVIILPHHATIYMAHWQEFTHLIQFAF